MKPHPKGPLALSLLIVVVGVGWLLTARGIGPEINWVWTLGLGAVGVVTFIVAGGVDKVSVVVGPFFIVASILSLMRQSGNLLVDTEVPILVIAVGVLLFIAQTPFVPVPKWFIPLPEQGSTGKK
jgi:hypothetical protein